jgi:hypothetical protein
MMRLQLLLHHLLLLCLCVGSTLGVTVAAAPLQATWVTLDAVAADAADGLPAQRCDHTFKSLQGAAQRPNAAVPFPAPGAAPSSDEYAGKIWTQGGHAADAIDDAWMLDVALQPPVWSKIKSDEVRQNKGQ